MQLLILQKLKKAPVDGAQSHVNFSKEKAPVSVSIFIAKEQRFTRGL